MLMFEPLRKYADFSGRARRKEYWLFMLFVWLLLSVLLWLAGPYPNGAVASAGGLLSFIDVDFVNPTMMTIAGVVSLLLLLPTIAVTVRRLHDIGWTGWWALLGITGLGSLILMIFCLLDGTVGPNRYGPDPKGRA